MDETTQQEIEEYRRTMEAYVAFQVDSYLKLAVDLGLQLSWEEDQGGFVFRWDPPADERRHWRTNPGGRYSLHLTRNIVNWRISEIAEGWVYDRHWCFAGVGYPTFAAACRQILNWAGDPESEPEGWIKAWDGRRGDSSHRVNAK